MKKIIILLILLIALTSCKLPTTISETVPCNNCSDKLLSWKSITECKPICEERFKEAKGSIIFGTEVKEFAGYQKNVQLSKGTKTVTCICKYK